MRRIHFPSLLGTVLAVAALSGTLYAQSDPPSRVARLNYISGSVSMEPAGTDDWVPAVINRPLTASDYLWADTGAKAELHVDNAALRLNGDSSIGFLTLDDQMVEVKLGQGQLQVRLRSLAADQVFQVDTPDAAFRLLQPGDYLFQASAEAQETLLTVRSGEAEVSGNNQFFRVNAGQTVRIHSEGTFSYDLYTAPPPNGFERFCFDRNRREDQALAEARYVPASMIGAEDLAEYGSWDAIPEWGPAWTPRGVGFDWAPYRNGQWAFIEPWGWSWVGDEPWGFAPFHYGRWAYWNDHWYWIPCQRIMAPVYAPALVVFAGGPGFGGRPGVAWFPLGPGEVYTPWHRTTPGYFKRVNQANTVVNNVTVTNIYSRSYVNDVPAGSGARVADRDFVNLRAPRAVTGMPQDAFSGGRPVAGAGRSLGANDMQTVRDSALGLQASVRPARQAYTPNVSAGQPVSRPPAGTFGPAPSAVRPTPEQPLPRTAPEVMNPPRQGGFRTVESAYPTRLPTPADVVRPSVSPAANQPARQEYRDTTVRPDWRTPESRPAIRQDAPAPRVESQPAPQPRQEYRQPEVRQEAPRPAPRVESQPAPQPRQEYRQPEVRQEAARPAPHVESAPARAAEPAKPDKH